MAIKEKLTPATKSDRFLVELYVPDCTDFTLFKNTDITHHWKYLAKFSSECLISHTQNPQLSKRKCFSNLES